jgi:hypothetical protein
MSPCDEVTTLEVSPNLEVSTGGQIGTDSHEQQRVATSRRIGPSSKRRTEAGERRGDDGTELSPEQALFEQSESSLRQVIHSEGVRRFGETQPHNPYMREFRSSDSSGLANCLNFAVSLRE